MARDEFIAALIAAQNPPPFRALPSAEDLLNYPREVYRTLTYGSAQDNTLVLDHLATHHGEIRFYPNGFARLTDFGTANGTTLGIANSALPRETVYGTQGLAAFHEVYFGDQRYTQAELRTILLVSLNTDALFDSTEVRAYEQFLELQKNPTDKKG